MSVIPTAERVAQTHQANNVIYQRHLIAYMEAEKHISGDVLEVGSGDGYGMKMLFPLAKTYTAIDKFPTPAAKEPGYESVKFVQASIPPLPFADNSFDFVVTFQVIEHIDDDVSFVREIARVLRPGGLMILTTPNIIMSLTRNPFHTREYTGQQLGGLVGKYFSDTEVKGVFGNEKVMAYYEKNKQGVEKITRWDILNLQYRLPRWMLQVPYDMANWVNRKRLLSENAGLVTGIKAEDHFIAPLKDTAFDLFVLAKK
jgi:SAM-dependent methyltransferase